MIKIVFIAPTIQHYRLSFYEKLANCEGYDLVVFHGVQNGENGRPVFKGKIPFKNIGFKAFRLGLYPFEFEYYKGMYSQIKKTNPDIIILSAISGNITHRRVLSWAKNNQKKSIVWTCGWEPGLAKGLLLKFKNKLVSSFLKKGSFFLTYSSHANLYLESMGINNSLIETCYNGIETDSMVQNEQKTISESKEIIDKYGLKDNITFLYVGGLLSPKKVDLLIDAFVHLRKSYSNIKLLIIGDGPLKDIMLKKIDGLADSNILYLGRITNGVDSYFLASDCLVLPGAGGLALNQAMYWEKPCIVGKADGTEEDLVIENFSGYRFEENNLESLICAMDKRINESPDKLKLLSVNAHQIIVNKSNVNNMVRVFSKAINNLITKNI
ncbi:MAG: glycosyltransferase [Ginsengibacter sp.]